ncbi:MAG: beta-galactosidase [Lentisphaeria bacterium]|nr:beta-galactosidase [Lentisphaeria bacterium]
MKRTAFLLSALLSVSALAETLPLPGWSIPEQAKRTDSEIRIDPCGQKHGALMWGPFRETGNTKVLMLKVQLSGRGEIQGSLGCYSADKKRFLTRHPFSEGTRKVDSSELTEEIWYLTLPEKTKEPVGWLRPVIRIASGNFTIREIEAEAFEKMPLIEEKLPLAQWLIPAKAKRTDSGIQIDPCGQKFGALMWGPFRQVGEAKVWKLQVKLSGKGEIQGSLGCYSADKKRFLARHPFADGTRKIDSKEIREEVWYLQLPKKPDNIGWIRAALRIVSGSFTIHEVKVKEMDKMPPRKNHLDTSCSMPGEVLPVYTEPNLFTGFPAGPGKSEVGIRTELELVLKKNASTVSTLSKPISVEPGKSYILTGLYHTSDLRFGNAGAIAVLTDSQAANWPDKRELFRPYSPLASGELVNRKPGEWERRTVKFLAPNNVKHVRIGVYLRGDQASIRWRSIYFGLGPWMPDSRASDYDQSWHFKKNTEPLPDEKVKEILAARPEATAEILPGNSPRILLNGKKVIPVIYFGDAFDATRNKTAAFQKAGIDLQIIPIFRRNFYWAGDKKYNFDNIDRTIMENVRRNPYGNFIIGLCVTPYLTWHEDFPSEAAVNRKGAYQTSRDGRKNLPCYYSKVYQEQAFEYIRQVIAHMRKQPYFKAVVGFHIIGNEDGQFYYQVKYGRYMDEAYSPSALEPFRDFLRKRYNNDPAALKKAWNRKDVTFENAAPPRTVRPMNTFFWDRSKDMAYWDVSVFMNEGVGEFVNAMCLEAKKAAGKKVIAIMWWGRGGEQFVQPHFAQTHIVLPGKGMDLMGGQPGYWGERNNGLTSYYPWIPDSLRMNGKIPMIEADFRTWTTQYKSLQQDSHVVRYWTPEAFHNAILREAGRLFSVGGGIWFYDMTAGWFDDPKLMKEAALVKRIADKLAKNDKPFTPAEIAFIADEDNFLATSEQLHCWNGPNFHSVRKTQRAMMRSGLKYDFVYLDDLIKRNVTHYKVCCFLNLFHVTPRTEAYLNSLRRDGKILLFVYAPGYSTDKGLDAANISRITGIRTELIGPGSQKSVFADSPLTAGLKGKTAGLDNALGMVRFRITDPKATALCTYADGSGVSGAMKKFADYTSIYIALPSPFTAEFLSRLAASAGIHLFNRTPGDMFLHRRDDLMVLHGVEGNENILAPAPGKKLYDMTTGEELPARGDHTVAVKLAPGETRVLECR